jgi:sirohydrochlorin ferrochelatase
MGTVIVEWLLVVGLSMLLGFLVCRYLTVHPLRMSVFSFASTVTLGLLIAVLAMRFSQARLWVGIALSLGLFLTGYGLTARSVLAREDSRPVPTLVRQAGDPGLGHTAVVYFTHGEPETYDPIGWINQFNEFDEQKIRFVPLLARPFFFAQLRDHYLAVGKSEHRSTHMQMQESLEAAYRAAGDETTRFYISFLDDDPCPDAAVIQALNDGASRIVVLEAFLTISNHTAEGKHLIEELGVEKYVPIEYTGPMYDSKTLQSMFVARANAHLDGVDKSQVGVLLVGHGQPDEWDIEWATETEQEIGFREDVLAGFVKDGYRPENLSLAWMEFKDPKPQVKVEEFAQNGAKRVFYFAAAISADAIHSQYDIPALVHRAKVPDDYPLINLGAWNDDPIVIQAFKEKIDAKLNEGRSTSPGARRTSDYGTN